MQIYDVGDDSLTWYDPEYERRIKDFDWAAYEYKQNYGGSGLMIGCLNGEFYYFDLGWNECGGISDMQTFKDIEEFSPKTGQKTSSWGLTKLCTEFKCKHLLAQVEKLLAET